MSIASRDEKTQQLPPGSDRKAAEPTPIKPIEPVEKTQPEVPKVGTTDAPGG